MAEVNTAIRTPAGLHGPAAAMALCGVALAALAGCQGFRAEERVRETSEIVNERLRQPVDWTTPWDDRSPHWTAGPIVRLDDALAAALRGNRALRADLAMIGQADADLVQAGLISNPVINFMVMFPSGGGRTMLRSGGLPMQPLQDLWLIPARTEVAQAELQKAVVRAAQRAIEIAAAVKQTYVEVQYLQRAAELIRANMQLVEQSTSVIAIRQTAGRAGQSELNLSRIRHQRLRSDLLSVDSRLRATKYELLAWVGAADGHDNWSVEPLDELRDPAHSAPAEPDLLRIATHQRFDLKAAEWSAEAAIRRVGLVKREGWPDLAVGLTFERAPAGTTPGVRPRVLGANGAVQASQQLAGAFGGGGGEMTGAQRFSEALARRAERPAPRDVVYTLGPMIEMELPIFDWNQAQTARALHEHAQKLAEYEDLFQTVVKEVRRTLARYDEAIAQIALYRESILPDVEQNLELARQTYVSGQTDLTIYLQAQEDTIDARSRLLEFVRDYRVTTAELERAVGGAMRFDRAAPDAPTSQPDVGPTTQAPEDSLRPAADSSTHGHSGGAP
ncbi:MAG: TolC family protein [Phycisphaerae bacterium]|nr:TolC family protein [Phycisphaerae bacterium]